MLRATKVRIYPTPEL
ncbi:helix-turn-helix domain-containing protein [Photorhabdus temperata]